MSAITIGLLSPGDMGHVVGQVLIANGARVITCLDGRSERTRGLAEKAGIEDVPTYGDLVREASLVICILVPSEAEGVASRVAEALTETGAQIVYSDCNAVAPSTAVRIGNVIEEAGSVFVDAGIIGGPPRKPGGTRFYCSGADTSVFEKLNDFGLNVRKAGDEVGQASGLKMCYAAQTKGTTALQTELLVAAQAMGLYDRLIEELELSQADRLSGMERGLPGMPTKAKRWIGEMEEIAKTFGDLGLTSKMYEGAADMYRLVSSSALADETPETRDTSRTLAQVIEIFNQARDKK
jgi:3-hydroxyisobutyrate dehydrogenase-like beta-hydroxyacid dehydrogenase